VACELLLLLGKLIPPNIVEDAFFFLIDSMLMIARLQECGGEFEDGRYFLRGESEDPVCVKCEERRLKA
jgi:hypothetical protein